MPDPTIHPGLKAVAQAAGVSLVTVSKILHGRYKGNTVRGRQRAEQVRAIADRLGYRRDAAAAAMRTGRTGRIGVVVNKDSIYCHPVLPEHLAGINERLEQEGITTVLVRLTAPTVSAALKAPGLGPRSLDGAIVVDGLPPEQFAAVARAVGPLVVVNDPPRDDVPAVHRDERQAGRLAGAALAAAGYRRATVMSRVDYGHFSGPDRWSGFSAAFRGKGRTSEPLKVSWPLADLDRARIRAAAARDAVLVAMDPTSALMLVEALAALGLRPGIDVGVASLDEMWGMLMTWADLARVSHDRYQLGWQAADLLLRRIAGERIPATATVLPCAWRAGRTAPGPV